MDRFNFSTGNQSPMEIKPTTAYQAVYNNGYPSAGYPFQNMYHQQYQQPMESALLPSFDIFDSGYHNQFYNEVSNMPNLFPELQFPYISNAVEEAPINYSLTEMTTHHPNHHHQKMSGPTSDDQFARYSPPESLHSHTSHSPALSTGSGSSKHPMSYTAQPSPMGGYLMVGGGQPPAKDPMGYMVSQSAISPPMSSGSDYLGDAPLPPLVYYQQQQPMPMPFIEPPQTSPSLYDVIVKQEDDFDELVLMMKTEPIEDEEMKPPAPPAAAEPAPPKMEPKAAKPKTQTKKRKRATADDNVDEQPAAKKSTIVSCQVCNKDFAREFYLDLHNRTFHSGEMPHRCPKCGKRFATEVALKTHQAKHESTSKAFKCPMCPKQFHYRTDLNRHKDYTHTGATKHNCEICGKGFSRGDHLRLHIEAHSRGKARANRYNTPADIKKKRGD